MPSSCCANRNVLYTRPLPHDRSLCTSDRSAARVENREAGMRPVTIDLNADLGESPERLADGSDAELMRYITSASVACGGHAGDPLTMEQTLDLARRNHVAVGAHPSYPDLAGFGRTALNIPIAELQTSIADQLS